jgi:hypothetical protein
MQPKSKIPLKQLRFAGYEIGSPLIDGTVAGDAQRALAATIHEFGSWHRGSDALPPSLHFCSMAGWCALQGSNSLANDVKSSVPEACVRQETHQWPLSDRLEMVEVLEAWPFLSAPLKNAVLAIIRTLGAES